MKVMPSPFYIIIHVVIYCYWCWSSGFRVISEGVVNCWNKQLLVKVESENVDRGGDASEDTKEEGPEKMPLSPKKGTEERKGLRGDAIDTEEGQSGDICTRKESSSELTGGNRDCTNPKAHWNLKHPPITQENNHSQQILQLQNPIGHVKYFLMITCAMWSL